MKIISFLGVVTVACFWLSNKAEAETICMRECPGLCMKKNTEAQEIHCYFFCVLNCEHCPNSPTGCPPNEETKKKLADANLNGMKQIIEKGQGDVIGAPRKLKNTL